MNRILLLGGLWLAIIAYERPLVAEVAAEIAYRYYPVGFVEGISPKETVYNSTPLAANADGRRNLGEASWKIKTENISFTQSADGGCQLQNQAVVLNCIITLPRLEGGRGGQSQIDFERSIEKIELHEMAHCDIALKHARRLEAELAGLGRRTCQGFPELLQSVYNRIVSECKAEQVRFDELEGEID